MATERASETSERKSHNTVLYWCSHSHGPGLAVNALCLVSREQKSSRHHSGDRLDTSLGAPGH